MSIHRRLLNSFTEGLRQLRRTQGSPLRDTGLLRRTQGSLLPVTESPTKSLAFVTLISLAVVVLLLPAGSATAAPTLTQYKINVDLDYDAAVLGVTQSVVYANSTGGALNSIVFNVTPAYYRAFALQSATVDGQPVQPSLNGVVMEIPLASPLSQGASTRIVLQYRLSVPAPGNLRFGKSTSILALGNWYPVVSPYLVAKGDWDRHQYTDNGDAFFTETADYEVDLNLNRPLTVASTGSATSASGNQMALVAKGVRDFAMAISDAYQSSSAVVDGTTITAFYLPQHAASGSLYLRTAAEVVRWANQNIGQYPYSTLAVAETTSNDPSWVGQEYPNIVFISSGQTAIGGGMGSYLSYLVAHEVLHQWFYALVGDDQLYEPWVDEATVTNLSYQFFRLNYPGVYPGMWQSFVSGERSGINAYGDRPVNTSIYDYSNEDHYFIIVYRKGGMFLDELRQAMGDAAYFGFLRDIVSRYSYKIVSGADYLDMAQARAGTDLRPLIRRYFSYSKYNGGLDYDMSNGHFYTQANGQPLGASPKGFPIVDDAEAPLWREFQRLGGVAGLGYPTSRRFKWDGFVSQAMQKGVLQWQPGGGRVYLVNVFDEMSKKGLDNWLNAFRQTPRIADWSSDTGRNWDDVVKAHLALLDANPAIKARYLSVPDPINLYGLPMSYADMGNNYTLRAQRVVIQQWKENMPWAAAGDVTVANGGDIAKEAGLLPPETLVPQEAP